MRAVSLWVFACKRISKKDITFQAESISTGIFKYDILINVQPHYYRVRQVEPCHHLGWSSQALTLSVLALGAMLKQQLQQQLSWSSMRNRIYNQYTPLKQNIRKVASDEQKATVCGGEAGLTSKKELTRLRSAFDVSIGGKSCLPFRSWKRTQ